MIELNQYSDAAAEFRRHFDRDFLGVIPRLLNDEGMFLSFVASLSAIECLAGAYMPDQGTGERFKAFLTKFFPGPYTAHVPALWKFRNRMIHAFNPRPFLILCHNSRMHLCEASGAHMLNAEDFYADLVGASRGYFDALYTDLELQRRFVKRINADDGGAPILQQVVESVGLNKPAV